MTHPYGSWPSPLTAEAVVAGQRRLADVQLAAGQLWWTHADPSDGGRITLWRRPVDGADVGGTGAAVEVTPQHYVRTSVHEYGGGAWSVAVDDQGQAVVAWSSWPEHQVWVQVGDQEPRAITPDGASPYRYAGLRVCPDAGMVLAIREDHSDPDQEPVNCIVALAMHGSGEHAGTVLAEGADFYASAELAPGGRLAWIEWDHPAMPWDHTRLMTGTIDPAAAAPASEVQVLLDDPQTSVLHPLWLDDGDTLLVSHDRDGWWQLHTVEVATGQQRRVWDGPHDICAPMWTLAPPPYALDADAVVAAWFVDGRRQLGRVALDGSGVQPIGEPLADVEAIAAGPEGVAALVGHAGAPAEIVVLDPDTDPGWRPLVLASEDVPDPDWISVAESIWWEGDQGPVQGWWYPPTHPLIDGPEDELPPLIVKSHGGPTSMSRPVHSAATQYWTSRGYGVLDVNYGGSSGFGREYRQRLAGQWGLVDVADCIGGARALAQQGLVDPNRLVITGGSAGGFTTLAALTASEVFAAGVSLYGIGDLRALARDTHKFESRYLDGLVGRWPEDEAVYIERSPISHVDRLTSPMLLLQGTEDKVVPPSQAETIADAVRAKGLPVALIMYEGEGHGFRRAESVISQLQATESFCAQVLGFTPAENVAVLSIENL